MLLLSEIPAAQQLCSRFKAAAYLGTPHQQLEAKSLRAFVADQLMHWQSTDSESNEIDWAQHLTVLDNINRRFEESEIKSRLSTVAFYKKDGRGVPIIHSLSIAKS